VEGGPVQCGCPSFIQVQWIDLSLSRSPGVTRLKLFKRLNILLACLIPQPPGTPRPHQWLLMGVQACRLPGLKPLKGLKGLKLLKLCKISRNAQPRRQKLPQGHIHRFFWAVQPAVRQALQASNPSNA